MLEVLFHAGTDHPNLAWVIIPSMLSFFAGLLIGRYTGQLRQLLAPGSTPE